MLKTETVTHVYLAPGHTDMRKSIDGLAVLVSAEFNLSFVVGKGEGAMDKTEAMEKFIFLARQIPDDRIEDAMEQLEEFLEQQGIVVLMPLEDESRLRPEFVAELREAEEEIRRGESISLDDYLSERGL